MSAPGAPYSLLARKQALDRLKQGYPPKSAPIATIRIAAPIHPPSGDGFWRRIRSLQFLPWAPTLFAWDWPAADRILIASG